jgi:hypothetical protein
MQQAHLVSDITPLDVGSWSDINESYYLKKESNMDDFFLFSALSLSLSEDILVCSHAS